MDASWWSLGQDLLLQHVVLAVAIVLFVEELGVPLLVPGDILMMLAGIEVARGNARLWEVLSVEMAVTMVAATILFFLSRGVGRPILLRYGRYLGVDQVRIAQVQGRISRYQFRAVVVGRLTPGLRVLTVMVAGLIDLEARRFLPALAVGAFLYLLAYTLLGYFAGTAAIQLVERLSIPVSSAVALGGLALLFLGFRAARDSRFLRRPLRPSVLSGLVAGLIAGTAGLLGSTVASGVLAVAQRFGRGLDVETVAWSRFIGLILRWPGFLLIAVVVGVLASAPPVRRQRPAVRLAFAALVPLALTLLVVNPALSGGRFIWTSSAAIAVALVPAARCLVFALTLDHVEHLMYDERPRPRARAAARGPHDDDREA